MIGDRLAIIFDVMKMMFPRHARLDNREIGMSKVFSVLLVSLAATAAAQAAPPGGQNVGWQSRPPASFKAVTDVAAAPEIDPASAFAGLTMLAGGLAVLRGRRVKK